MNNDPIADLLTRIRNAAKVSLPMVELPGSKLKLAIVKLLQQEGYVRSFEVAELDNRTSIRILLKYDSEGRSTIRSIQRVSRPGLRKYFKVDNLPKVLSGAGIAIVSTSKGLLTDREARKQRLGGEILCAVY
jgi:small subunit ribosomal protein S8